jgi:hypothetical protein
MFFYIFLFFSCFFSGFITFLVEKGLFLQGKEQNNEKKRNKIEKNNIYTPK